MNFRTNIPLYENYTPLSDVAPFIPRVRGQFTLLVMLVFLLAADNIPDKKHINN